MEEMLEKLLAEMEEKNASDLHITVGVPPQYRVFGTLEPQADYPKLGRDDTERIIYSMLSEKQIADFKRDRELDCSIGLTGKGRYRVNVFLQRDSVATAIRRLPYDIPQFEELGLPAPVLRQLCEKNRGMILLTGPTGSGKSTSLAAMVDYINQNFRKHIISVEDPIEYLHYHNKCVINQREVGQDTSEFRIALRHILRQDPDVVQIGEMRDIETIRSMLTVAETGHLAFSTLHTNDTISTVNRIIDVFPHEQQQQVRIQLSFVLQAVIAQQLLPMRGGEGRALACEVMVVNPAIRNLIREEDISQIYSQLQMGREAGMQTMNASLAELVKGGLITESTALSRCSDVKEMNSLLG